MFPILYVDRQNGRIRKCLHYFQQPDFLAGLLENTTGMPIPQKTADKLSN